jgi:hypothetical protein
MYPGAAQEVPGALAVAVEVEATQRSLYVVVAFADGAKPRATSATLRLMTSALHRGALVRAGMLTSESLLFVPSWRFQVVRSVSHGVLKVVAFGKTHDRRGTLKTFLIPAL